MPVDMKLLIAETFGKLAQRGNIDKITVKALIEECHISRQTFYYHFQDIMDVLEWSVRRQTQALLEQSLAEKDLHSALQIFISFTVQHSSAAETDELPAAAQAGRPLLPAALAPDPGF